MIGERGRIAWEMHVERRLRAIEQLVGLRMQPEAKDDGAKDPAAPISTEQLRDLLALSCAGSSYRLPQKIARAVIRELISLRPPEVKP